MKANEAPEKIYLQQYDENTLICLNKWNISEEWTNKPCNEKIATNIEYTRTDAFIEKACAWLEENADMFEAFDTDSKTYYMDKNAMIEQFKKAIEL